MSGGGGGEGRSTLTLAVMASSFPLLRNQPNSRRHAGLIDFSSRGAFSLRLSSFVCAMSLRIPLHSWRLGKRTFALPLRRFYSADTKKPPFPTVPTCPSPTCECAAAPLMPEGLPIDHQGKLNGLISSYAEQVLVCTGKDDWPSRVEEDNSGDNLAADLKELFGRGGVYSDVSGTPR